MTELPQSTNVAPPAKRRWPRWARRGLMEGVAIGLIALGVGMLVQPFVIEIYSWSFTTVLVGTAMFTIVSKFPE